MINRMYGQAEMPGMGSSAGGGMDSLIQQLLGQIQGGTRALPGGMAKPMPMEEGALQHLPMEVQQGQGGGQSTDAWAPFGGMPSGGYGPRNDAVQQGGNALMGRFSEGGGMQQQLSRLLQGLGRGGVMRNPMQSQKGGVSLGQMTRMAR